jgi:hypothetical protein
MPTPRTTAPAPQLWAAFLVRIALGLAGLAAANVATPAFGQDGTPQPLIPNTNQRSGLMTRYVPIESHLPPDPRRDQWYDTRWGDAPNLNKHPNFYRNGGLYGLHWPVKDTRSIYPYFYGSPGQDTITEESRPVKPFFRIASAMVHPFKPVGHYYDQGTYVPVYDLDPIVPGPGSWPFPFYRRITNFGG